MVVDRKLSRGSLDRGARRQKTLDPHTFGMITTLAPASWEPPSSRHLFPHHYISKDQMQRSSYECCSKNSPNIVQNLSAMIARSTLTRGATSKAAQCLPFSSKTLTGESSISNATGPAISCVRPPVWERSSRCRSGVFSSTRASAERRSAARTLHRRSPGMRTAASNGTASNSRPGQSDVHVVAGAVQNLGAVMVVQFRCRCELETRSAQFKD